MKTAILYSSIKPDFLLPDSKTSSYSQYLLDQSTSIFSILPHQDFDLIYDLTYSPVISTEVLEFCTKNKIIHLTGYNTKPDSNPLSTESAYEEATFLSLLKHLSISKWAVVYTLDSISSFPNLLENSEFNFMIESDISQQNTKSLIQQLKYSEISTICLLLPGKKSFDFFNYLGIDDFSNYIWILSENSDPVEFNLNNSTIKEGVLRISRSESTSYLNELVKFIDSCRVEEFYKCIKDFSNFDWKILNLLSEGYVKVGSCESGCSIRQEVTWPKGVTDIKNHRKTLQISFESSLVDYSGTSLEFLRPAYQGIELGISYLSNISNSFILNGTYLKIDESYQNESSIFSALESIDWKLGLVTISPPISGLAVSLYKTLENSSKLTPMIGYSNTVSMLSSQSNFPYYSRVCMPDTYITVILSMMAKYFGWNKIGVLYIDNLFSRTLYDEFTQQAEFYGLEILNKGNNKLPENSNLWKGEKFNHVFEELGNSEARIIIVFCFTNEIDTILVKMQELGFYGDSYEYLAVGWLVDELINPKGEVNSTRLGIIRKALLGSLMFFPVSFVSEYGEIVKDKYRNTYGTAPVGYTAFAFDSVLAIFNTFQSLIQNKKDYENPSNFMNAMRNIRFIGTTGPVTFQQGKNDRSPMDHYILNTRKVNESHWEIKTIGIFSPTSLNVFTFYDNITWPGGKLPADEPISYKCPFPPDSVTIDPRGTLVLCLALFITAILVLFSCSVGCRYHRDPHFVLSPDKKYEMTFMDILNISKIGVEFFQYLGLIPSLPAILSIFKSIGNVVSLDLEALYLQETSIFWFVFQLILSLTGLSLITRLLNKFGFKIPYSDVLASFSSDLLFISTLSTLLNIFLCYETSSTAFLHFDCKTRCWQGEHLILACFTSFILVFYCLMAVYDKTKWSSGRTSDQNVAISGLHTYVKALMQTLLICMKKILFLIGITAYSTVMLICVLAYLGFNYRKKAYNVEIVQHWNVISYWGVAVVCLFSIVCEITGSYKSPMWLVTLLVCWCFLLLVGLIIQKMKQMKWPFSGGVVDLVLLKFAFQNKKIEWVQRNSQVFQNLKVQVAPYHLPFKGKIKVPPNSCEV